MTSLNNRNYFILLTACSILFLFLFFILSYYNRLAADDLYYLGGYSEIGIWGCMRDLYFGYSGRWSAYLLTGWIVSMNEVKWSHLVFNFFTFFTLITVVYLLIRKIFSEKINIILSPKIAVLFSVILTGNMFFASYSIGETWFWLVQVCTYLWSIIMSLVLLYVLIDNKMNPIRIFLLIISALFIGGASGSYALVNIFFLTAYLFFSNVRVTNYSSLSFQKSRNINNKIIIALFFLLVAFTITMIAPGNEVRYGLLPKGSFIHLLWVQIKSFIKIIFIKTPFKLPYLILFSFPWFILGNILTGNKKKKKLMSLLYSYTHYFLIALVLIFIFLLPTSFIMGELGPDRSLSLISFFVVFCFATAFFDAGTKIKISKKIFQSLQYISMFCTIGILIFHLVNQYSITKKYANAIDSRIGLLKTLSKKEQKNIIELEPLPSSGMLYSAEISVDTSHFTNYFLEHSLRLRFHTKKLSLTYPSQRK